MFKCYFAHTNQDTDHAKKTDIQTHGASVACTPVSQFSGDPFTWLNVFNHLLLSSVSGSIHKATQHWTLLNYCIPPCTLNPHGNTHWKSWFCYLHSAVYEVRRQTNCYRQFSCIPDCAMSRNVLGMAFSKDPWLPKTYALSRPTFWHHTHNVTQNPSVLCLSKAFSTDGSSPSIVAYLILTSTVSGVPKLIFCGGWRAFSPAPDSSVPALEVSKGGLGKVLSSLENSLHMTHFRYPQILRRGERGDNQRTSYPERRLR